MFSYEVFVAVVELKNISAAANKLNKSASAISKQLSGLEAKLGVQLLDRSTRSVSVTEVGQQFYLRCVDILRLVEEAEGGIKESQGEPCGKINVTWPAPISFSSIPKNLSEFCLRYPKVLVDLDVSVELKSFATSNLDIAFRFGELDDSSLVAIPLGRVEPVLCASAPAVERWGRPNSLKDLESFPTITQSNLNMLQKGKEIFKGMKQLPFKENYFTNDIATMLVLAKNHMGATVVFRHMIQDELKDGSLQILLPDLPLTPLPLNLLYRGGIHMPQRLRCFIDFFKGEYLDGRAFLS